MDGLHKAGEILLAHGKEAVWEHSQAVADEAAALAGHFGLDVDAAREAGLCHDLGGIYPAQEMLEMVQAIGIEIDPAEQKYPFLLHQQLSAMVCREQLGITRDDILQAVACHTTLRAEASKLDMVVFLTDKLAWDQPGKPPYEAEIRNALRTSLEAACLAHITYVMDHGMILMPHTWLLEAKGWLSGLVR